MKKTLAITFLFCTLFVAGCEKNEKYDLSGTITAEDMALCACCDGYFIKINKELYRFEKTELPLGFTFSNEQLPINVELKWKL